MRWKPTNPYELYHPLNGGTRSDKKTSLFEGRSSGEGGIRTHEPLRVTRAPGVRAKPDYATSPLAFRADELYQTDYCASSTNKYRLFINE